MTKLADIAPRLARARDQMAEIERVLGWMRDNSWTGGVFVLVPVHHYINQRLALVYVDHVSQGDASPYPIKGTITIFDENMVPVRSQPGQWAFWEVEAMQFLAETWPVLLEGPGEYPAALQPNPTLNQEVI